MPSAKQFKEFARVGAAIRLNTLAEETRSILAAFPDLRNPKRRQAVIRGTATDAQQPVVTADKPKRRKRKLTAAEKKVISARMKVYWAERKKKAS